MMAQPRTASSEGVMLIPATTKRNTTGYKNVTYNRRERKFKAEVNAGGKRVHLGYFNAAEEAAVAYARSEYGRADAAKLLQPRPAPTSPPVAAATPATKASATARSSKAARSTS